jgi:hypothetical protein
MRQNNDWNACVRGVNLLWLPIPAHCIVPIILTLMIQTWWAFALMVSTLAFFAYLRHRGRTATWLLCRLKCRLRGGVVYARPIWFRRRTQYIISFDAISLIER